MQTISNINTSGLPDPLFSIAVQRSIHTQVSHLRNMKRFPDRVAYRMGRLPPEERDALNKLLDLISTGKEKQSSIPKACPPSTIMDRVPPIFIQQSPPKTPKRETHYMCPPTKKLNILDQFLKVFQQDENNTNHLYNQALLTPPPPTKRGAIRQQCKENGCPRPPVPAGSRGTIAYVELRKTGNVCATLRVRSQEASNKVMWIEVNAKQSQNYETIVKKIKDAVNTGDISTKAEAVQMRDALLAELW